MGVEGDAVLFRFIHCADIHLDSPMRGLRFSDDDVVDAVRNATRRALENLVASAIRERVDFVVIAGDVFDGDWEDYSTGLFFNRCMHQLADAGILVCLIRGNHDAVSQLTRNLTHPDNVFVFSESHPETWRLDKLQVAIHGQSFAKRDVTDNLAVNYPASVPGYFNIGVLHTGLQGKEGHAHYAPCQIEDLLSLGYDYFALGHIHQPEVIHPNPPIVYAGNIQGRHVRESGARGCVLVTVPDDGLLRMERVNLDVLRWFEVKVDLGDVVYLDVALTRIRDAVEEVAAVSGEVPLCIRVRLTGIGNQHVYIHRDLTEFEHEVLNTIQMASSRTVYVEQVVIDEISSLEPMRRLTTEGRDGLVAVLKNVIEDSEAERQVKETLVAWQRSILAKMRADDAPEAFSENDIRREMEHAVRDVLVQLRDGGEQRHGIS